MTKIPELEVADRVSLVTIAGLVASVREGGEAGAVALALDSGRI